MKRSIDRPRISTRTSCRLLRPSPATSQSILSLLRATQFEIVGVHTSHVKSNDSRPCVVIPGTAKQESVRHPPLQFRLGQHVYYSPFAIIAGCVSIMGVLCPRAATLVTDNEISSEVDVCELSARVKVQVRALQCGAASCHVRSSTALSIRR
jgi:hypothetical protein